MIARIYHAKISDWVERAGMVAFFCDQVRQAAIMVRICHLHWTVLWRLVWMQQAVFCLCGIGAPRRPSLHRCTSVYAAFECDSENVSISGDEALQ
jgi:hypothetical protein